MSNAEAMALLCRICRESRILCNVQQGFSLVVEGVKKLVQVDCAAIILIDPATEYLRIASQRGLSETFTRQFRRPIGTGPVGEVLWTGAEFHFDEARIKEGLYDDFKLAAAPTDAMVAPLHTSARIPGYLQCERHGGEPFGKLEACYIRALCELGGLIYERAQLVDRTRELTITEPGLDIYTFSYFHQRLQEELVRRRRTRRAAAVGIIDVDNLKALTNMLGTESADDLMKQIAKIIKDTLRAVDLLGFFGRDEIALLLPETDSAGAARAGDRLVEAVRGAKYDYEGPRPTISVGLATTGEAELGAAALLQNAQKALFRAQLGGRDRAVVHPATE